MEPDRELDALIAEKIMGYQGYPNPEPPHMIRRYGRDDRLPLPGFSTDIAAAWTVVEKLATKGWRLELNAKLLHQKEIRAYAVDFDRLANDGLERVCVWEIETAPLAICLAALEAVGVEVEDVQ